MRGTGRSNLALDAVAEAQAVGASPRGLAAGLIIDRFDCDAAFGTSTGAALFALAVLGLGLPETGRCRERQGPPALTRSGADAQLRLNCEAGRASQGASCCRNGLDLLAGAEPTRRITSQSLV
jgi:hypothetical protein